MPDIKLKKTVNAYTKILTISKAVLAFSASIYQFLFYYQEVH